MIKTSVQRKRIERVFLLCMAALLTAPLHADLFRPVKLMSWKSDVEEWNGRHMGKISLTETRFGCWPRRFVGHNCQFSGVISNNSSDSISKALVEIVIKNKSSGGVAIRETRLISTAAVPTASVAFESEVKTDRLALASEQLGEDFSWTYTLLGFVPEHLKNSYPWRSSDDKGLVYHASEALAD